MEELKIVGFGSEVAAEDSRLYTVICQAQGHTHHCPVLLAGQTPLSFILHNLHDRKKKLVMHGATSGLFGQQAALFL